MDRTLSDAAMLAWDAALTVRGRYGRLSCNEPMELSARRYLAALTKAHNPHLARLATDAARASSFIVAIPRADGRKADVISIT
jgi:hypothetical protein